VNTTFFIFDASFLIRLERTKKSCQSPFSSLREYAKPRLYVFQKAFQGSRVTIVFQDESMRDALENLISSLGYEEQIEIMDVNKLIEKL